MWITNRPIGGGVVVVARTMDDEDASRDMMGGKGISAFTGSAGMKTSTRPASRRTRATQQTCTAANAWRTLRFSPAGLPAAAALVLAATDALYAMPAAAADDLARAVEIPEQRELGEQGCRGDAPAAHHLQAIPTISAGSSA